MGEKYSLGLVLSGGAARGLAHLGVVKALYEKDIKPDCISGTSARLAEMAEQCDLFIEPGKLKEFGLLDLAARLFKRNLIRYIII